jgi:peptide/nickel transport system substrate-binding protein
MPGGPGGSQRKLSKDVREAIMLALDYKGSMEVTVASKARPLAAPLPRGFPGVAGITVPHQRRPFSITGNGVSSQKMCGKP